VRRGRRHQQLRGLKLARHLRASGIEVLEVERPKHRRRSSRRNVEKSDPLDAEAAARAVLAGETSGVPKSGDGRVEMIRALRAARRSAIKARTQAANQLQGLRVRAPEELRRRLRGLSTKELVSVAARFRLGDGPRDVPTATRLALRSVARRHEALSAEIAELDAHLDRLVAQAAPELVSLPGIGTENAATLLIVAGDNPQRLRSEASFASLCGVAPIEASSGKVVRHRLNRGGNREANRALYMICLARMRRDRRTQEYVARRTAGEAWQEQARDHPLPQALRRQGDLPRVDLLRRPFLADKSKRRGPHRCWEQSHLTIGASLGCIIIFHRTKEPSPAP
jgi:transposase